MPTTECLAILQDAIVILLCPPCRISGNNCTDNTQFFTESLYVSIFKQGMPVSLYAPVLTRTQDFYY